MSSTRVLIDIIGRDGASPAFDKAGLAAERAAKRISGINAGLGKAAAVGATMTKRITLPVVALAAASVDTAVKFQRSMTLIQTAGGETVAKTTAISKGMSKVAVETGTTLGALESGIYTVAKAGAQKWSAAGQLNVLRVAAQGAKAENTDLGTSVNALTSVMMSYGLGAGKAVQVENELIKGSGLAKTTMQEYASSLATVVPIASKAHISFAEIGGAIATLTQHGTSADESTQELANTIRNLQAPSQVAQKAMQQIGLGVNDVTHNLGRRGLTGTLDLIESKMSKSSKAGMIVVSAFKHSAAASADLTTMIGKMPRGLADLSRGLLTGKENIKGYQKAAKDLGGTAGPMGLQFLSLYKSTKGFNDLLKSGQPGQRTAAAELRDIMGGATGLNTALQLGGDSAGQFKGSVQQLADAAKGAGKDVLGWSKTQDTLAVKWDKTKAQLQVLGLEIGNTLIPALGKLSDKVRAGVEWFDHLGSSSKKIIGVGVLVVAAVGPAVAIISRLILIGKGLGKIWGFGAAALTAGANVVRGMTMAEVSVETMGTKSWAAGFRIGEAFRNMNRSARLAAAGLAGAGIGLAVGQLTKDSSTAVKTIGLIGSTAAGAAIGFSMGGPWGAAIGGVMGGLSDLLTSWNGQSKAAQDAAAASKQALLSEQDAAQNLYDTLQQVNGAYAQQTRTATISQLSKSGALDLAGKAGLDLGKLTDATLNGTATDLVNSLSNTGKLKLSDAEYEKLVDDLSHVQVGSAKAEKAYELFKAAQSGGVVSTKLLSGGLANLGKELKGSGTELEYSVKRWSEVNGKWGMHSELVNADSALAKRNTEVVKENIAAMRAQAVKQAESGKSLGDVTGKYQQNTNALEDNLVKLGFARSDVEKLIATQGHMPKSLTTEIAIKSATAQANIKSLQGAINRVRQNKVPGITANSKLGHAVTDALQHKIDSIRQGKVPNLTANDAHGVTVASTLQKLIDGLQQHKIPGLSANASKLISAVAEAEQYLNSLHDKTVTVHVNSAVQAYRGPGSSTYNQQVPAHKAAGGAIHGRGGPTEDKVAIWASNGEHMLTASDVSKLGGQGAVYRMRSAIQSGMLKYASGGAITRVGKGYRYNGQTYSSLKAAQEARRGVYVGRVSTAVSAVGQPYSPPFDVSQVGYSRVMGQIKTARAQIASDLKHGFITAKDAASARAKLAGLAKYANTQLGNLRVKIAGADMAAIRSSFKGTADDARQAFSTIFADLSASGASKAVTAAMQRAESSIVSKMGQRDALAAKLGSAPTASTAYDKLDSARQAYSDMRDGAQSATSAWDLGSVSSTYNDKPLTADAIVASKSKAAANATKFAGILQQLIKEGLDKSDVLQLAQEGPAQGMADALALAKATPAQIKSLSNSQSVLDKAGSVAGKTVADKYEKAGVDSAQAIVNGLLSQESALNAAITTIADGMLATLRHSIAQGAGKGSSHGSTSHRATTSHGAHGGPDKPIHPGKSVTVHGGIHIHKATDTSAAANAVVRRLAHLGST